MRQEARSWLSQGIGVVRLRQFADRLRHRLSFVPLLYVIGAAVTAHVMLLVDEQLSDRDLPGLLITTVDSARAVFSAITGGLITSITLLLSMMLVAVQLASSQFSPRTLRDWLGDRVLQHTIGLVLGTTVYCLLGLRATGTTTGNDAGTTIPHLTVVVAVLLAVLSLLGVVRSVDHITHSVRVGSVARRIADATIRVIRADDSIRAGQRPGRGPARPTDETPTSSDIRSDVIADQIPADARPIEAEVAGWIQQIDDQTIVAALPSGATGYVTAPLGGFVNQHGPIMWVSPPPPDDDECLANLLEAFAVGDTRTLQQDVSFGLLQLSDVAVRALSPGVNDPSTANDVIVHLGNLLIEIWAKPVDDAVSRDGDKTLVRRRPTHREFLDQAFSSIRRYAAADPDVLATMIRTIATIRDETQRRQLPGPIEPLEEFLADFTAWGERANWTRREIDDVDLLGRAPSSGES